VPQAAFDRFLRFRLDQVCNLLLVLRLPVFLIPRRRIAFGDILPPRFNVPTPPLNVLASVTFSILRTFSLLFIVQVVVPLKLWLRNFSPPSNTQLMPAAIFV
jgi:hypothetical protein